MKARPSFSTSTESRVSSIWAFHCAQSIVEKTSTAMIKMPPMVGVPFLLSTRAPRPPAVSALSA